MKNNLIFLKKKKFIKFFFREINYFTVIGKKMKYFKFLYLFILKFILNFILKKNTHKIKIIYLILFLNNF